jgi:hypothetical protein
MIPRRAHQLYAWLAGWFWTPCPLCGAKFGGHEWRDIDGKPSVIPVPDKPGTGTAICPACTRAGLGRHPVLGVSGHQIHSCPDCGGDLDEDACAMRCPRCERTVSYSLLRDDTGTDT